MSRLPPRVLAALTVPFVLAPAAAGGEEGWSRLPAGTYRAGLEHRCRVAAVGDALVLECRQRAGEGHRRVGDCDLVGTTSLGPPEGEARILACAHEDTLVVAGAHGTILDAVSVAPDWGGSVPGRPSLVDAIPGDPSEVLWTDSYSDTGSGFVTFRVLAWRAGRLVEVLDVFDPESLTFSVDRGVPVATAVPERTGRKGARPRPVRYRWDPAAWRFREEGGGRAAEPRRCHVRSGLYRRVARPAERDEVGRARCTAAATVRAIDEIEGFVVVGEREAECDDFEQGAALRRFGLGGLDGCALHLTATAHRPTKVPAEAEPRPASWLAAISCPEGPACVRQLEVGYHRVGPAPVAPEPAAPSALALSHLLFGEEPPSSPEPEATEADDGPAGFRPMPGELRAAAKRTREEAKALAEAALDRARAGEPFLSLAKELSSCPTAPLGGWVGTFDPAALEPSLARALAAVPPGAVLPELVETPAGFHVVRRERPSWVTGLRTEPPPDAARALLRAPPPEDPGGEAGGEPGSSGGLADRVRAVLSRDRRATLLGVDETRRFVAVRLDSSASGDGGVTAAARFFAELTALEPGTILAVEGASVPSAVNPMDGAWAKRIAELAAAPVPFPASKRVRLQRAVCEDLDGRRIDHHRCRRVARARVWAERLGAAVDEGLARATKTRREVAVWRRVKGVEATRRLGEADRSVASECDGLRRSIRDGRKALGPDAEPDLDAVEERVERVCGGKR